MRTQQRKSHTHAHLINIITQLQSCFLLQNNGLLRYTNNHNIFRTLTIIWKQTLDRPPAELVLLSFKDRCSFKMVTQYVLSPHWNVCFTGGRTFTASIQVSFFKSYSLDPSCFVTTNRRERSRPCIMNISN